ncbi:hypothetical protein [Frigidibacter sp. MR17.24]|uniref:hypothetical protein n=1 Tax=Frigidibacter sp. MR17.24 TaxID=3127345 RepID=UPI0030130719
MAPDETARPSGGVQLLVPRADPAAIDRQVMIALYEVLGELEAERQIAATVEAIALRLIDIRALSQAGRLPDMAPLALAVRVDAERLGLVALGRAAQVLARCAPEGDATAVLAVLSRLLRLGEQALGEILGRAGR